MKKIKIGIVGGSGYAGAELLRLLLQHPLVHILAISSRADEAKTVAEIFPNILQDDLCFCHPQDTIFFECDLIFYATPTGVAMQSVSDYLEKGIKIIDLSADFRIRNPILWQKWYRMEHTQTYWLKQAVYGLPEMNRDLIKQASLVANPGCYPTSVLLGLAPLLGQQLIHPSTIIIDAKSGVSGAGRSAKIDNLLTECSEDIRAYNVHGHRHQIEMEQELSVVAKEKVNITFVPHLTPMIRGILSTMYCDLQTANTEDLETLYKSFYAKEPFVKILSGGKSPRTRTTKGSNYCQISMVPLANGKVIVMSVIDNLIKGAAGQAIQNMNLMCGFEETQAIDSLAMMP